MQPLSSNISPPLLQVCNLSKQFFRGGTNHTVLHDLSFEIALGELLVLVGPSGCGKSTLLGIIAGFEKPTAGEILLKGAPVAGPGPDRLIMFQEHALFPWLNVIENVLFGLTPRKDLQREERITKATDLLKMVHLDGYQQTPIHQLSGGMKHRVALARALAPDPAILLIDEPFQALDTITKQHMHAELQEISSKTSKTILAVTHDPLEAACLADRVLIFSQNPGEIRTQIAINLPRPRTINHPDVRIYARAITEELEK